MTAIASSGNVYKYSLISRVQSSGGEVLEEYTPEIVNHVELSQSTWDTMHDGMEAVVGSDSQHPGTYSEAFADSPVRTQIGFAGKSGTAEQAEGRANHGTFIGYAPAPKNENEPYVEPEVAVSVSIPNGYGASNAATIAEQALELYYGFLDLETLLENNNAADMNSAYIPD